MSSITDSYERTIEASPFVEKFLKDYLPGWRAELYKDLNLGGSISQTFTWKLRSPAVPDERSESVHVLPVQVTTVLHNDPRAEMGRVGTQLIAELYDKVKEINSTLVGYGWREDGGLFLPPQAVARREQERAAAQFVAANSPIYSSFIEQMLKASVLWERIPVITLPQVAAAGRRWRSLPTAKWVAEYAEPVKEETREDRFVQQIERYVNGNNNP